MLTNANLLVNIDVPNINQGIAFFCGALGFAVGRCFDEFV